MTFARKWGPWVLLLAVAGAVLVIGLQPSGGKPSVAVEEQRLASEVRCPVCNGETALQSQAAPSVEIRNQIHADLVKGEPPKQIIDSIVATYGTWILEKPPATGVSLLVWIVPVVGAVLGAIGLLVAFRRWRAVPAAAGDPPGAAEATSVPEPEVVTAPEPEVVAAPEPEVVTTVPRKPSSRRAKILVGSTGVLLIAAGASWAVVASSGTRLPGQEITGQSLGSVAVLADLQTAQDDQAKNDVVGAIQQYQKVLNAEPTQVEALTGEGWLLAETGDPSLLRKGLAMLVNAEQVQAGYAPAHVYRGLALLTEGDYSGSIPELQWYLGHSPAAQLVAPVKKALTEAQVGQAAASAATSGAK
jgi:cytochrome c-type biogenesis protein CcmH